MTTGERNLHWAELMVEALVRRGVDHFVICPGSRSSPLVLALSQRSDVKSIVHQDERGAGYFAVGYARATGKAAAVVTTSGTAAVNLFPAIVEASTDNLPLIVITADRPPELHDCGANQTIDQIRLYGDYIRTSIDFPCPDDIADLRTPLREAEQALDHAFGQGHPTGPIHFNCRFREPLVPSHEAARQVTFPTESGTSPDATAQRAGGAEISEENLKAIRKIVKSSKQGLMVIGQLRHDNERQAALNLSRTLSWPTLADVTSGIHGVESPLIAHCDLILASEHFCGNHIPDTILHVGGRITSKRLLQFTADSQPRQYLHNSGDGIVYDPEHCVTLRTSFDNAFFCRALSDAYSEGKSDVEWLNAWSKAAKIARRVVTESCDAVTELTEPGIAFALSLRLNSRSALFLASSMPIRDVVSFGMISDVMPIASNRVESGIEGTIASACGYAAGLNCPVTLLIGDQAFLHDLNSLSLVRQSKQPVVIVIVNNNGGRIFELLPISEQKQILEPLFVAPHGMTFGGLANGFGIRHIEVRTRRELEQAYVEASSNEASIVIEALVEPAASREHRLSLIESVKKEVDASAS